MSAQSMEAIEKSVIEVNKAGFDPGLLCTFEARNSSGEEVWAQVLAGSVNTMYPFADDPITYIKASGVEIPRTFSLLEWEANSYATFDTGQTVGRVVAQFVDQLFIRVLGCEDGRYEPAATVEEIEE